MSVLQTSIECKNLIETGFTQVFGNTQRVVVHAIWHVCRLGIARRWLVSHEWSGTTFTSNKQRQRRGGDKRSSRKIPKKSIRRTVTRRV